MKRRRRLDQVYNTEEYRQLLEILPVDSFLYPKIQSSLELRHDFTKKNRKIFISQPISSYMINFFPEIYEVMYNTSFNSLALFINTTNESCMTVLTWRLTINK
jgi:hypothetical protein